MINVHGPHTLPDGICGILFAEDFDELVIEKCMEGENEKAVDQKYPIEPTFSLSQIQEEKNLSYAEGVRAGEEKIESQRSMMAIKTFSYIEQTLSEIDSKSVDHLQKSANSVSQLLFSTLSAILPNLCARHQVSEITGLVESIMDSMTNEPTLSISVAPEMMDQLRVALCILSPEKSRRVVLVPYDGLPPGEAKISWQDGAASSNARRAQDAVTAVLIALELLPPPLPLPHKFYPSNTIASSLTVLPYAHQEVETANG